MLALTTPGSRTDPVIRGKWIYTRLMCGVLADPPPGVPMLAEPVEGQSVRERLAMHQVDPGCRGCHVKMDPLGFALEHYDALGRHRTQVDGVVVDASGVLPELDVAGPFTDGRALSARLADSEDVRRCFARHWVTFALGHTAERADRCTSLGAEQAWADSNATLPQLLRAIIESPSFLAPKERR